MCSSSYVKKCPKTLRGLSSIHPPTFVLKTLSLAKSTPSTRTLCCFVLFCFVLAKPSPHLTLHVLCPMPGMCFSRAARLSLTSTARVGLGSNVTAQRPSLAALLKTNTLHPSPNAHSLEPWPTLLPRSCPRHLEPSAPYIHSSAATVPPTLTRHLHEGKCVCPVCFLLHPQIWGQGLSLFGYSIHLLCKLTR